MNSIRSMSPLSDFCALICASGVFAAALLDAPVQARPITAPSIAAAAPAVDAMHREAPRAAP
jgi:hypothetical protein